MKRIDWNTLDKKLLKGGLAILPTDTVYGIHCFVDDKEAVEKLKAIKERVDTDFFIILISKISDIEKFEINLKSNHKKFLIKNWPAKLTVVLVDQTGKTKSFRIPDKKELRKFIEKNGPLYSTSANKHGEKTIENLKDLDEDLESKISYCIDEETLTSDPSIVISFLR
jgi:L-threonylcarbamoyladenylate synthase